MCFEFILKFSDPGLLPFSITQWEALSFRKHICSEKRFWPSEARSCRKSITKLSSALRLSLKEAKQTRYQKNKYKQFGDNSWSGRAKAGFQFFSKKKWLCFARTIDPRPFCREFMVHERKVGFLLLPRKRWFCLDKTILFLGEKWVYGSWDPKLMKNVFFLGQSWFGF